MQQAARNTSRAVDFTRIAIWLPVIERWESFRQYSTDVVKRSPSDMTSDTRGEDVPEASRLNWARSYLFPCETVVSFAILPALLLHSSADERFRLWLRFRA
jgi:hypothetical protein